MPAILSRTPAFLLCLFTAMLASVAVSTAASDSGWEVRARVGPWPVVSQVIGYRGRIWFANSVKGRNHNSADLWSLDPELGDVRYERHLYSQDAGVPLVRRGLLYWPFEDSRFSLGWGMIQVTDGTAWRPITVPTARIFHSDSLVPWQDRLLLVTSAWRTGFQTSDNLGGDWQALYDHPTPQGRLSRFYEPVLLRGDLYGYLSDPDGMRLARFADGRLNRVSGWPDGRDFFGLTIHRDSLYAIVRVEGGFALWRTDGRRTERVGNEPLPFAAADLASDGSRLWAVSRDGGLWSSVQDERWTRRGVLSGGRPLSLHVVAGKIYVAGAGADGRGILWGPPTHRLPPTEAAIPLPSSRPREAVDWKRLGAALDTALGDLVQYRDHGRGHLRTLVFQAVRHHPPPGFFKRRLQALSAEGTVAAFGGGLTIRATDLGQTLLFWGMGLSGQADVPVAALVRPWTATANSFEKYFDPQGAAIWAVAASGQKDAATLDALVARLSAGGDPLWLRSQVVGALTALTGQPFAYDIEAWRTWWASARSDWAG